MEPVQVLQGDFEFFFGADVAQTLFLVLTYETNVERYLDVGIGNPASILEFTLKNVAGLMGNKQTDTICDDIVVVRGILRVMVASKRLLEQVFQTEKSHVLVDQGIICDQYALS